MDDHSIYDDPERLFATMTQGNPNLPTPTFPKLPKVQQEAKSRAQDIFADKDALFGILERYEVTLRKRWVKKTGDQRRKVLSAAYPNIPSGHRPDFDAIRRESTDQMRSGSRFRDSFLLPSLNAEDLLKPKNLLLFMHSRGRNNPGVFANSDFNSIHLGTITQAIVPSYLSGYTMLLLGQNTVKTYGRLVSWDEDPDAFDMMSKGTGIQPGEGLLILEIQQRKLRFLLRCAQQILQDLPLEDSSIPRQPVPLDTIQGIEDWPSLTNEVLEAPYRVPDHFDISRLQTFVSAKRSEAEDHIWSLREDPSYFKDVLLDASEHRQEKILSTNDKPHPILRRDEFWERVIGNMLVEAYLALLIWDLILKDVNHLGELRDRSENQRGSNYDFSEDYEHALCHFSYLIEQAIKGQIGVWKVAMVASPPLRKHFVREPLDSNNPNRIVVKGKGNPYSDGDPFLWLMGRLTMDDQLFLCGLDNILDELERLIRSDLKSRERLSALLAYLLSNMSLLAELKRQIGLLRPGPPMTEALSLPEQEAEFAKKSKLMTKVFGVLTEDKNKQLSAVGTPPSKFNYPSHKRRTAAVTKELQEAESNLDAFWNKIDSHAVQKSGKSLHGLLVGVLEERKLQRTPDWKEPDHDRVNKLQDSSIEKLTYQLSAADLQQRTEETIGPDTIPEVRSKEKTRGIPNETKIEIDTERPNAPTAEQPSKFAVSKRGFKVFSTMFYTPSQEEPPGEIPWSEFLSAMASIGFSVKSLDGSAWIFAPTTDLFGRSIIFHEPHPYNKIPYRMARRYGRRLERAYGWTGDTFVRG